MPPVTFIGAAAVGPNEFTVGLPQAVLERWVRRVMWHPNKVGLRQIVNFRAFKQVKQFIERGSRLCQDPATSMPCNISIEFCSESYGLWGGCPLIVLLDPGDRMGVVIRFQLREADID